MMPMVQPSTVLTVAPGMKGGGFGAGMDSPANGGDTPSIAIGDVNGDKKLDVVVATSPGSVFVNMGNGTFAAKKDLGFDATAVALADMDGDKILDLVTGNLSVGNGVSVNVLIGKGDGTFTSKGPILLGMDPSMAQDAVAVG